MNTMPDKRWVLVPLLTGREKDAAFVEKVKDCGKVVLVFIADPSKLGSSTTVEAGEKIRQAEQDFADFKKQFNENTVVKHVLEWGPLAEKVEQLAHIEQVDEVIMADSVQSRQIAAVLSSKGIRVTIF